MRIINHLIAADLRRHRLLLAAWLAIVIATTALAGVRPLLAGGGVGPSVSVLGSLLSLTHFLLLLVLIPTVVQTHPLVGGEAFWMTRPIPPDALLVAKLVLLGAATVVIPMIAETVLTATYGVPPAQIAAVTAQTALYNLLWLMLLATAAAVTPNLTRFALLCGGALVSVALLLAGALAISMATLEDTPPTSGDGSSGDPTSTLVLMVLIVVAGLTLLVVQYRTRSRLRSVPLGAAIMVLAFCAASAWRWPILAPRLEVAAWTTADDALRLNARADTVRINEESSPFARRTAWRLARARVRLTGIEPRWTADAGVLDAALRIDGGPAVESRYPAQLAALPVEDSEERPTRVVLRRLLGVDRLIDSMPPRGESPIVFCQRDVDFRKVAPAVGTYHGRFTVRLTRHDLEATLPLEPGAVHQNAAYRFVIRGVERASTSVSILASESDAVSIFDRLPPSDVTFYLRNAKVSEAVAGFGRDPDEGFGPLMFLPFSFSYGATRPWGFRTRGLVIRFPENYSADGESLSMDDAWFRGAELVIVRAIRAGAVERTLEIAGFPLR